MHELEPKGNNFVNASFSQLHELTSQLGKFKYSMTPLESSKHLVKVYYEDNSPHLSMYTLGGFRYFASIQLPILAVFPLKDGVIVKCKYDEKLLKVSFNRMNKADSYAYLTLTKHPLEDIRALSLRDSDTEGIKTLVD